MYTYLYNSTYRSNYLKFDFIAAIVISRRGTSLPWIALALMRSFSGI